MSNHLKLNNCWFRLHDENGDGNISKNEAEKVGMLYCTYDPGCCVVLEIVIIHAKTSVGFSNISNIFENLLGPERE